MAELVADGLTNRDVAERLLISPHTVSGHLRNIFLKLNVKSRVELARVVGPERGVVSSGYRSSFLSPVGGCLGRWPPAGRGTIWLNEAPNAPA